MLILQHFTGRNLRKHFSHSLIHNINVNMLSAQKPYITRLICCHVGRVRHFRDSACMLSVNTSVLLLLVRLGAHFSRARERSTVLQGRVPESHLFSLSQADGIGQPGVPPTNTTRWS